MIDLETVQQGYGAVCGIDEARGQRNLTEEEEEPAVGRAAVRRWRGSKSYPYLRGRSIVAPRNLNGARDYRSCRHEGGKRGREIEEEGNLAPTSKQT